MSNSEGAVARPLLDPLPVGRGEERRRAGESRGKVRIARDPRKGRCVVAVAPIAAGERIEAAPAVVFGDADCEAIDRTALGHYYFWWDGDADGIGRGAVALGITSLCNHSERPVAEVLRNYEDETLDLVALEPIAPGTEVTIHYKCELWFEPSD